MKIVCFIHESVTTCISVHSITQYNHSHVNKSRCDILQRTTLIWSFTVRMYMKFLFREIRHISVFVILFHVVNLWFWELQVNWNLRNWSRVSTLSFQSTYNARCCLRGNVPIPFNCLRKLHCRLNNQWTNSYNHYMTLFRSLNTRRKHSCKIMTCKTRKPINAKH